MGIRVTKSCNNIGYYLIDHMHVIEFFFASVSARMWSMVTGVTVHWGGLGQTVISTLMIAHLVPA